MTRRGSTRRSSGWPLMGSWWRIGTTTSGSAWTRCATSAYSRACGSSGGPRGRYGVATTEPMSTVTAIIRDDARLVAAELARELRPLAGTTLLLTGAGGFIGSYLLDVLTAVGREGGGPPCHVVALDNFRVGLPERVQHLAANPDIEFLSHDVTQPLPLGRPVEWLIHGARMAAATLHRRCPRRPIARAR